MDRECGRANEDKQIDRCNDEDENAEVHRASSKRLTGDDVTVQHATLAACPAPNPSWIRPCQYAECW